MNLVLPFHSNKSGWRDMVSAKDLGWELREDAAEAAGGCRSSQVCPIKWVIFIFLLFSLIQQIIASEY